MAKVVCVLAGLLFFSFVASTVAVEVSEAAAKIPVRLRVAESGEWALYSMTGGAEQRQTITQVREKDGDRLFTVLFELVINGETVQSREEEWSLRNAIRDQEELPADTRIVGIESGQEKFGGRELSTVTVDMMMFDDTIHTVFSETIPVTGVLRVEVNGGEILNLVDFGGSIAAP
ncbi:MAG: hypothetical protein LBU79_08320 [Planctomycetota bacterium]|jgi:hypothetical protein|nr:hypothetical protein [Planctomycetota bacterium]